jgi:bifunctional UDP-N-acetylglucosamine pyrophosphorylase/glucosamine-1-phosphate N-acetyltransferase
VHKGPITASIIFAAGKGSRMKGFDGNKTLLPLVPAESPYEGSNPILINVLNSLPPGPKAVVVNHGKEKLIETTRSYGLIYCEQPILNGTGGALLASMEFIENQEYDRLLITMGDVPLVRPSSYERLLNTLAGFNMAVLGFRPKDKKEYGVLEIVKNTVKSIIEWKYWKEFPDDKRGTLNICNSGIYAVRKEVLIRYLDILGKRPHTVIKERDGIMVEVKEFFITDLVQLMYKDGLKVGYVITEDEDEVMGVDDLVSLIKAQEIFKNGLKD